MVGRVEFVPAFNTICRPTSDDEYDVMQHFASYALRCPRCENPFRVYLNGDTLCERGHAYARDVAQYVYSKAGKAYSVADFNATGARVQIKIPPRCDAVRGLLKAVNQGLEIKCQKLPAVVSHDRTYPVAERRRLPEPRYGHKVLVVAPWELRERKRVKGGDRRRDTVYVSGRGSLYEKDEEERQRQQKEKDQQLIVYAQPRRGKTYHR